MAITSRKKPLREYPSSNVGEGNGETMDGCLRNEEEVLSWEKEDVGVKVPKRFEKEKKGEPSDRQKRPDYRKTGGVMFPTPKNREGRRLVDQKPVRDRGKARDLRPARRRRPASSKKPGKEKANVSIQ